VNQVSCSRISPRKSEEEEEEEEAVSRRLLIAAVAVPAAPVGPLACAGAQQSPGGALLSGREVELRSARAAFGDALLAAYICATSPDPPRGVGEAPAEGG
jgi:hypothetical protein